MEKQIVDNILLLLISSILVFQVEDMVGPVLALLLAILAASLGLYLSKRKQYVIVTVLFALLSLVLPELALFLPILLYHSYKNYDVWEIICIIPFLIGISNRMVWVIAVWLVLCVLSVILASRTRGIMQMEQEMIRMRDSGTELTMVLRDKNKNLIKQQNNEIYLATLKERNRIAREIHDNVGHMLSRSILQVGALGTIYKEEPLHSQLGSINETLNGAMNSIRESVHDLHDDSIDLKQAVLEATRTMQEKYLLKIDYDMSRVVPRNIKYCFITTIKEAMSNITKHSNAEKIEIVLREHPGFYQLTIEDDGTKRPLSLEGGIGLDNMRERVEALNGTILFQTEKGFRIFISIKKEQEGRECAL